MPDNSTWYGRAARAFGDTINVGVNAATGGLLNRGIGAVMGASREQVEQVNQDLRQRTGVGGDIAAGVGAVYGLGKAARAGGAVVSAARAAPTAAALVPTAGLGTATRFLAGRAGPGLVPVVPRLAVTIPKASTVLKAAAGLGIVGGSLADGMSSRVTPTAPTAGGTIADRAKANAAAYTPEEAAAWGPYAGRPVEQALATGRGASEAITPYEQQMQTITALLSSNIPARYARGLINELPKPESGQPRAQDVLLGQAALRANALQQRRLELAADPGNEELKLGVRAMEDDFNAYLSLAGRNPNNLAQAQMIPGYDPEAGQ